MEAAVSRRRGGQTVVPGSPLCAHRIPLSTVAVLLGEENAAARRMQSKETIMPRPLNSTFKEQLDRAYRRVAEFYRPSAPSDGFGNIPVHPSELDLDAQQAPPTVAARPGE